MPCIHSEALETSTTLTGFYVKPYIKPIRIIQVLNKASLPFVVLGVYGMSGWMREPRASQALDLLVGRRNFTKAFRTVTTAFPVLEPNYRGPTTALSHRDSGKVLVQMIRPNSALEQQALKRTFEVRYGHHRYRIPTVEMAIAWCYAAMTEASRAAEENYRYAHDFLLMVKVNPQLDFTRLAQLGAFLERGGARKFVPTIRSVQQGKKFVLSEA